MSATPNTTPGEAGLPPTVPKSAMLGKVGTDMQEGPAMAKSSAPELNLKSFFAGKERKQAETAQMKSA